MARRPTVRLNSSGIQAVLKSDGMRGVIGAKTEQVARYVRAQGIRVDGVPGEYELPVKTSLTTTDRAHGRVTLAHPAGQAVEAKHGALGKAALEAGLEVNDQ